MTNRCPKCGDALRAQNDLALGRLARVQELRGALDPAARTRRRGSDMKKRIKICDVACPFYQPEEEFERGARCSLDRGPNARDWSDRDRSPPAWCPLRKGPVVVSLAVAGLALARGQGQS